MNENLIYAFIALAAFIAYRKYTTHQVLKLVPSLLKDGGQIVDVRSVEEFVVAHKDGSINIPLASLNSRIKELDKSKPVIVCCASGSRSGLAKRLLKAKGFESVHNAGVWRSLIKFIYTRKYRPNNFKNILSQITKTIKKFNNDEYNNKLSIILLRKN